jgi:transposase
MVGLVYGGKEKLWRGRLRRFDISRLTVAEFCKREGVSIPSFYQWRKRIAAREEGTVDGMNRPQAFIPVRLTQGAAVEIHLPNGTRVCLPPGDGEVLRVAIEAAGRLGSVNRREAPLC